MPSCSLWIAALEIDCCNRPDIAVASGGFDGWRGNRLTTPSGDPDSYIIVGARGWAKVVRGIEDTHVVQTAANLFVDDVQRVTRQRPRVISTPISSPQWIIMGTVGRSSLIQGLAGAGRLKNIEPINGR